MVITSREPPVHGPGIGNIYRLGQNCQLIGTLPVNR